MPNESQELLYANGIDGETGGYSFPPATEEELAEVIRGQRAPENLRDLRIRRRLSQAGLLGTKDGVDPTRIDEAGWGVIFSQDADPAIKEALTDLIDLRKTQAGAFFRCYDGEQGLKAGESKTDFLARFGMGPGPADPDKVPYYLLLVGSPEAIPYRFQSQLDVQYAVGRIHFNTLQEYANYARSVADSERGAVQLPRRATFFGVANADDPATQLSSTEMIGKLHARFQGEWSDWELNSLIEGAATKTNLESLLGGQDAPAFLFTASHGMGFKAGNAKQMAHQGALICAEWPGPRKWAGRGQIPEAHYFAADHLASDANLLGMIAFFYACFGAGTPLIDEFAQGLPGIMPGNLAPFSFVAALPKRMLSLPRGGALAVVGHVERTWPSSFRWREAGTQLLVYEDMLTRLRAGNPIGYAVERINERYAELSTVLNDALQPGQDNEQMDAGTLARWWMANNDARGYAIVGDPAVRLPVDSESGQGKARPTIQPVEIAGQPAPDAPRTETPRTGEMPASGKQARGDSDLFVSFSPLPHVPEDFARQHPELYAAWVEHITAGYKNNDQIFQRVLDAFMRSHNITLAMYVVLFIVGISFFVAALILALFMDSVIPAAAFGGLSVLSFIAYFLSRPTQAVEENLHFITWLGIIYNSYWTRLAWTFDAEGSQENLEKATNAAIEQLNALIDKHAAASGRRPGQGAS
jgi:hypothetical protein